MGSSPSTPLPSQSTLAATSCLTSHQLSIGQNIRFSPSNRLTPQQHNFIVQNCRRLSFLDDLPQDKIKQIASKFRICYSTQQWMFKQGSKANYFFIIAVGQVQIVKNGFLIRNLEAGEYFGEMALLYGIKRSSFVRVPKQYRSKNMYYALHRNQFLQAVCYIHPQKITEFLSLLQPNPNMSYLTYRQKIFIGQKSIKIKFKQNERILTKYDQPYALFIISKGIVRLTFPNKRIIDISNKTCFGYFGFSEIWSSAVSVSEVVVYAVGKNVVDAVLGRRIKYMRLWNKTKFALLNSNYLTELTAQRIHQLTNMFTFTFTTSHKPLAYYNRQVQKILIPLTCNIEQNTNINNQQKSTNKNWEVQPIGLEQLMSGKKRYQRDYVSQKMGHFAEIDAEVFMKFVDDEGFFVDRGNGGGFLWGSSYEQMGIKGTQDNTTICKQNRFNLTYILQKANPRNTIQNNALVSQHQLLQQLPHPFLQSFYFFIETPTYQHLAKQIIKGVSLRTYVLNVDMLPQLICRLYLACILLALQFLYSCHVYPPQFGIQNCVIAEDDGWLCLQGLKLLRYQPNNAQLDDANNEDTFGFNCFEKNFMELGLIAYQLIIGQPFQVSDTKKLHYDLYLPPNFKQKDAKQLLYVLLSNKNNSWRKIKQLNYFKGIDWQALKSKQIEAPILPGFMSVYSSTF